MSNKLKTHSLKLLGAILGAGFIALFAQLTIELPLNEAGISITGQTFAILLAAFFLGRWYGLLAVVLYIAMGAAGLPVFSDGASGIENLYGGSGGYFSGFLFASYRVGAFGEAGWRNALDKCILAMLYGTLIILILGVLKLSFTYGFQKAVEVGFYPFIWGGIIKVVLGGLIAYAIQKIIGSRKSLR